MSRNKKGKMDRGEGKSIPDYEYGNTLNRKMSCEIE